MKLTTLKFWHSKINEEFFGGELATIPIFLVRSNTAHGYYRYDTISLATRCLGILMHEMIHQWQHEVMGYDLDNMNNAQAHDSEFADVANSLSIRYNIRYTNIYSIEDRIDA